MQILRKKVYFIQKKHFLQNGITLSEKIAEN